MKSEMSVLIAIDAGIGSRIKLINYCIHQGFSTALKTLLPLSRSDSFNVRFGVSLSVVVERGHLEVIKILYNEPGFSSMDCKTLLLHALTATGNVDLVMFLVERCPNPVDALETAAWRSVLKGHLNLLRRTLEDGRLPADFIWRLFILACRHENRDIFTLLLSRSDLDPSYADYACLRECHEAKNIKYIELIFTDPRVPDTVRQEWELKIKTSSFGKKLVAISIGLGVLYWLTR
ncbi:Hypothetical protein POVR2_LOCUS187 [uncultured virus]|nr:Hypothetical protein POVR2_LOCUS187 [uncultured virus]